MKKWEQEMFNAMSDRNNDNLTIRELREKYKPKKAVWLEIDVPKACMWCIFFNKRGSVSNVDCRLLNEYGWDGNIEMPPVKWDGLVANIQRHPLCPLDDIDDDIDDEETEGGEQRDAD